MVSLSNHPTLSAIRQAHGVAMVQSNALSERSESKGTRFKVPVIVPARSPS